MSEKQKAEVLSRRQLLGFGGVAAITGYTSRGLKSASWKRPAHRDERLYHGPMRLPERVLAIARTGRLVRTRCRHSVIKIRDGEIAYLFRTFGESEYLGEIIRTHDGRIRVHVWSLIDCPDARSVDDLIAHHAHGIDMYAEQESERERLDNEQETME